MDFLTKLINRVKNNNGSALVIVLFIVVLVSVLGFSLLNISANSLKQVDHERKDQAVFYIAEAGMNLAKIEVKGQLIIIQEEASQELLSWIDLENTDREKNKRTSLTKTEANEKYRAILNEKFSKFTNSNTISDTYNISNGKIAQVDLNLQLPAPTEDLRYLISISSTGYIETVKERIVKQDMEIKPTLPFDESDNPNNGDNENEEGQTPIGTPENYAVLTRGDIIFNSSGKIYGNVTSSQGNIVFKNGGAQINGVASIDQNTQKITPSYNTQPVPKIVDPLNINVRNYLQDGFFPSDKFNSSHINSIKIVDNTKVNNSSNHLIYNNGNFDAKNDSNTAAGYTIDLTKQSSIRFKNFQVYNNKTIYIDVGEKDTDLYIDNLDINQGHIKIKGSGKLNLYINNFTQLKGSFNKNGDSNQVNFIYNGSSPFKIANETQIYGSLINKSANISLENGTAIYGNIISSGTSIYMNGNVPVTGQSVIAPYATLTMGGSSKIIGTSIVDNINFTGNNEIHYQTPVFPLPPGVGPGNNSNDLGDPDSYGFEITETNLVEK